MRTPIIGGTTPQVSSSSGWSVRPGQNGGWAASATLDPKTAAKPYVIDERSVLRPSTTTVELPRAHTGAPTRMDVKSLAAWLSANPVATGCGAAVMGLLSFAGTVQGAPLSQVTVQTPTDPAANARERGIVYVGMNADSKHEVQNLQGAVGQNNVTYITTNAKADVAKLGNVEYDLTTPEGRTSYVEKLGLTGDRAAALVSVLEGTNDGARDEMAQIARVFAQAEKGDRYIERIVFSGHSVGSGVWGDGNGTLSWDSMAQLTAVFPRAAGQIQDLMIAGCYSGGEEKMDTYRGLFPNVKTIWAYDGSAPGAVSGAVPHILRWERGTRGPSTDNLRRESAEHTRKGENVAVWTVTRGYSNGQPLAELQEVLDQYTASAGVVAQAKSGELAVDNPQTGPLRDHYNHIQRLLGRRDLTPEQRTTFQAERDQVIRLLYYKNVSTFFQLTHKSAIETGFRELGMQAPDFSKLSRQDALKVIAAFDAKVAEKGGEPSRTVGYLSEILHGGLQNLENRFVPDAWM